MTTEQIVFLHQGVDIENPTVSSCGRGRVSPEQYGFYVHETGGGCTAWRKDLPDGEYLLLTHESSHELDGPTADYGHYSADGDEISLQEIVVGELDADTDGPVA